MPKKQAAPKRRSGIPAGHKSRQKPENQEGVKQCRRKENKKGRWKRFTEGVIDVIAGLRKIISALKPLAVDAIVLYLLLEHLKVIAFGEHVSYAQPVMAGAGQIVKAILFSGF